MAEPTPVVVVHGLDQALAALAAAAERGGAVELWSAAGAAAYLGPLYWKALEERLRARHPDLAFTCVLDCAERPGDAMAALRAGVKDLCFTGLPDQRVKLQDLARQSGARLRQERPGLSLDLKEVTNPTQACRLWFCTAVENSTPLG